MLIQKGITMDNLRKTEKISYVLRYCLDTDDVVSLYNEMVDTIGGNPIYRMVDFDEIMCGVKPLNLVIYTKNNFSPNERFFYEDSLGQIISFDECDDPFCPIDVEELADFMVSHNTGIDELEDKLIEAFCQESDGDPNLFETSLRDYLETHDISILDANWANLELTIAKEYKLYDFDEE